jgi:kynurenine formamidase
MDKDFLYKLIDLTHMLDSNIPTWNGSCGFNHE